MNSRDLIKSITRDFFSNKDDHIVYFSLSGSAMEVCKNSFDDNVCMIDLAESKYPLAPFLDIVSLLNASEKDLEKNVYKIQKNIFSNFIKNGTIVEREEPIIVEEIDFEKNQIQKTILSLIEKLYKSNTVILNSQLISEDALNILRKLPLVELSGKFVFCFNNMDVENYSASVKDFLNSVSGDKNYYSINSFENISENRDFSLPENENSYEHIIEKLRALRIFMDFNQAYRIVKKIDSISLLEEFDFAQKRMLSYEMGLDSYYSGDSDFASFCFSNVTEAYVDDELDCYANYMLACLSSKKNMTSTALKYVSKGLAKAKKFIHSPVYALLKMTEYIITERTDSEFSTDKYFNAISLLERTGFLNNKVYTSLIIPYGVIYDNTLRQHMRVQIEKSMEEAKVIGNIFGLSTACHWMGIIMTYEGRKNNALEWYQKCFALRKEIGDVASITKITNGIAFEYMVGTKYKISYDLVNNCVENLLESRDYPEIVITLFNFARAAFYTKNIERTYEIFQCIYNLLNIFDISDLAGNSFVPELNDVLVYVALVDLYRGEFNRAKMNLYNVSNNGKKIGLTNEFLRQFLLACVELRENNVEFAIRNFNECIDGFIDRKFNQDYMVCFMCYEFACMLKKHEMSDEAEKIFQRAHAIAEEKELTFYSSLSTIEDYENLSVELEPVKIKLSLLEEKAEKEKLVNQLHRRLRDSSFLNKLVTTHVSSTSDLNFASSAVQSIFDYTMADAVFMAEKNEEDDWKMIVSNLREEIKEPTEKMWRSVEKSRHTVHLEVLEDGRNAVYINLSKFEFVGGIIIYLQQNMQLSVEERNILNVAASNIQAQLVMIKQNEYLSKISATDQLSKLNNRRALLEHISMQSEMIRRYDKKHTAHMIETICFLDLDNFKYYNDTFGHEAGDLLISSFAALMKKIYRKVDFVARFGGDEFVVMLPNTNCAEACRAAERLYEGLSQAEHFIPDLREMLKKDVFIPEDKYLNFSMGICTNDAAEDISNLELIMSRADKALYYSKQHKKGTVTVWENIPELNDEK